MPTSFPCLAVQAVGAARAMLPQALSVNGVSDSFQLFVIVSCLGTVFLNAVKTLSTWWDDWVHMPSNITRITTDVAVLKTDVAVLKTDVTILKTDVAVLKTDVAVLKTTLRSRTAWLSFLDTYVLALPNDLLKWGVSPTLNRESWLIFHSGLLRTRRTGRWHEVGGSWSLEQSCTG